MKDALIIYSGGMDSTCLLNIYRRNISLAITFQYGSKHNAQELEYAKRNCILLGIDHKIITLDFNAWGFKSALLQGGDIIPDGHYEDESMKKTVVPFRNGIMLAIAAGIASSKELERIMLANHAGDHAIYPDCRPEFISAFSKAVYRGTETINIFAPFTASTKRQIALLGVKNGIDFTNTYSCYKGGEIHCGTCGTCTERKEALLGFDTTKYLK